MDIMYTDFYGEKAYLTTQEINWFRDVCELCKAATSINLPIEPHNQSKRKRLHLYVQIILPPPSQVIP